MGLDSRRSSLHHEIENDIHFQLRHRSEADMFLLLAQLALVLPAEVLPDPSRFTLQGQVLDATRSPLVDARVAARPDAGGPDRSTTTDPQGRFSLALDPGEYTVEVAVPGFLDATQ